MRQLWIFLCSQAWLRYALAIAVTALAALLRWSLPQVLAETPYLAFYPAVVAAAAFGGAGPGLLAAVGSALCVDLLFDATPGLVDWRDPLVLGRLAIFLAGGLGISLVAGLRRTAVARERQQSKALREAATKYRTLADHTHDWEFWRAPDGRFLYVSPACQKVTGYPAEAFLADPYLAERIIHPEDQPFYSAHRLKADKACATEELEFRIVHRDGDLRWIGHTCVPVFDETGLFLGTRGSNRDITARKQAEAALRASEGRYRLLFNEIDEGFCIIELLYADGRANDWRFIEVNPAFERHNGLKEATGKTIRQLTPNIEPHWFEQYDEVARTGRAVRFVESSEALGGRWFDLYAFRVGAPEQHRVAVLFTDITTRRRAERELETARISAEQAKAAAEEASRAKDQFLAVLSHELRTPLTPVVAAVSMLQKQWHCDAPTSETLEMIRRNVEMEARLIDDLLDVTRITRGKIELDRRPIPLCEVIHRAVEVCKPDIEARRLHFGVDIGPAAPYIIHADAARLQQVFWNLLKNAIKFTPPGGCVGIRCWPVDHAVITEIADSGEGIEADLLSHIFNPFEQGGTRTTRQFGGLGLGLTITRGLVEMHGGSITAHSDGKGRGAAFRVQLPLHEGVESHPPSGRGTAAGDTGRSIQSPAKFLRILLVEDHGDTARAMRRLLMSDGHQVQTAGDVAAALELAAQGAFDLLISDLGLPDASGLDLMRQLRQRGFTFPGIALSGYGQEEDILRSREAGFASHLTKPTSPERLLEVIAGLVGREG